MTVKLDENQKKAVEHFEGPALVVAGPGSGKTTVIIERILNLVHKHKVDPRRILALAFNKDASKEMEKRVLSELVSKSELPEIRTLHAFGLKIISQHYDRLKRENNPEVWPSDPERTIRDEIQQLKRNMANVIVTIYKIESELTGKCYIGQTTDPKRRKKEHFSFDDSSNPDLRQAMLNEGKEHFKFCYLDKVEGKFANRREAKYIEYYRNRAVVNLLESEVEQPESGIPAPYISIYKIENKKTGICYILQSIDSERSEIDDFTDSSNDLIREAIEIEGIEQFTLEVLQTEVPKATVPTFIEHAIQNASSRSRAVFNQNNPLRQRYSDQLMIELFCEHFNICYDELLKYPSEIENLRQKIEDFEKIIDQVQKAKRQVVINFSKDDSVDDIVNSIIQSIDNRIVRVFAEKYEKKKKKANAIDFQDMILYAVYLLETSPDIRARCHGKYDYVLIDEFQDVSPIDFRLIKPLSENLFAVGDDDQAIYSFRGGDSEIMQKFGKEEDVTQYKITRNYRSMSAIVKHSSAMIKYNNPNRISKNLLPENPATRPPIKVLETTEETIKIVFLREFVEPICQTQVIDNHVPIIEVPLLKIHVKTEPQNIGIPLRYRSEVEAIRKMLLDRGFKEEKLTRKEGDPFKVIGRSKQEIIEGITIHKAKGKEYNKVILIHNTLGEDFPFHDSDDITEDRRVFYVAMTRAKQELVILGGKCQFVTEMGLLSVTSKRKKRLERVSKALRFAILKRINIDKKHVEVLSERIQTALTRAITKQAVDTIKAAHKQNKLELECLGRNITQAENTTAELEVKLPIALKSANKNLLEDLIPVLDEFEALFKNLPEGDQSNNTADYTAFTESVRFAQEQLCASLKNHGLKPIEVSSGKIFNPAHHEETSSAIYSDEVPAGLVVRAEQHGYLLDNQIVRKAQVVISKKKKKSDVLLSQDFAQPVRFGTYKGFCDLRNIIISKDEIRGINLQGEKVKLQKLSVLFAFPREDIASVKLHIKWRQAIANRNLQPIKLTSERFHISDDVLKSFLVKPKIMEARDINRTIQLVTRYGYILNGYLSDFDEHCLYISINEKVVVVYRSGILDFKSRMWNKILKAYKNGDLVTGHIIKKIKNGLCVKFGSLYGFLPKSEVELSSVRTLDSYVGERFKMKIVKLSKTNNDLDIVLSRRAYLKTELSPKQPEPTKSMKETESPSPILEGLSSASEANVTTLHKSTDSGTIKSRAETIESSPPTPKGIFKMQIQNLKPETLETETSNESLKTSNDNSDLTSQKSKEILKKHIQNLKPALPEKDTNSPSNTTNNASDQPIESIDSEPSEQTSNSPSSVETSHEEELPKDESQDKRKKLGFHLRKFGRYALRKLKSFL